MKNLPHSIVLAVIACSLSSAADATRPNIFFVLADDWGWRDAGSYGRTWIQALTFDRLARGGPRFDNAYTPDSKCAPSSTLAKPPANDARPFGLIRFLDR